MNLNYLAFFLISFVPLITGWLWFSENSPLSKTETSLTKKLTPLMWLWLFLMSFTLVYGFINLEKITSDFLAVYGDKHRHFGHGVFHGVINALVFALPFLTMYTLFGNRSKRFFWHHLSYWIVTCALVCGLISEFV